MRLNQSIWLQRDAGQLLGVRQSLQPDRVEDGIRGKQLAQLPTGGGDINAAFPAALNYLEDKEDLTRTARLYVFDDHGNDMAEFQTKLLKRAFTAMSFGVRRLPSNSQCQSQQGQGPGLPVPAWGNDHPSASLSLRSWRLLTIERRL